MLPGDHWRRLSNGGRERISNSALARVLRKPNDCQTISDFLLNTVRALYLTGNSYSLCLRNERFEIDEIHSMDPNQSSPQVARSTGTSFILWPVMILSRNGSMPFLKISDQRTFSSLNATFYIFA